MSDSSHPVIDRYLTSFSKELVDLPEPERSEVIGEIRNHAAEAIQAGEEPATVLERFGDPRQLAQAYKVELTLEGSRFALPQLSRFARPLRRVARVFAILGLLAVTSITAFVVIIVLGALTLALTAGGVAAGVAGLLSLVTPGTLITSTLDIPHTISELLAIAAGVAMTCGGVFSGAVLFLYARMVARAFRRKIGDLRSVPA